MSMAVMVLLLSVVSSIYFASLRVWRRCSSQSQADPPAHMSLDRMTRDLKNSYVVNSPSSATDYISVTLPAKDSNGTNIYPFQAGYHVTYYLSDVSGEYGKGGTWLWREQVKASNGQVRRDVIARNVSDLRFDISPSDTNRALKICALSIAVVGEEKREQYVSRFSGTIAFRN